MIPPRLLTVAVPTYQGSRYLAETLRSILSQSGVEFDLIVSDDQSDDDTLSIVEQVAGRRSQVFVNETRLGLAGNWNACVTRSRTPWTAIVHQDDLLRPGHLAALAKLAPNPSLGLIATAAEPIDEFGNPIAPKIIETGGLGPVDRIFKAGEAVEPMSVANPLRCSAVMIRNDLHRSIGGFDPSYRYVVDWDFWLKAARIASIAWLAHPSVAFRWHLASETHAFKTGTADLEETERLLKTLTLDRPHQKAANRRLARAYLNRAYEAAITHNRRLLRTALGQALARSPWIIGRLIADPRLVARLVRGLMG